LIDFSEIAMKNFQKKLEVIIGIAFIRYWSCSNDWKSK